MWKGIWIGDLTVVLCYVTWSSHGLENGSISGSALSVRYPIGEVMSISDLIPVKDRMFYFLYSCEMDFSAHSHSHRFGHRGDPSSLSIFLSSCFIALPYHRRRLPYFCRHLEQHRACWVTFEAVSDASPGSIRALGALSLIQELPFLFRQQH
ncbi:hypothetical protein SRHO_G00292210 [Serrasalmus rhombeus]